MTLSTIRRTAAAVCIMTMLAVPGCDKQDPVGAKLDQAHLLMQSLTAGASASPASASQKQDTYTKVIAQVRSLGDSALPGQEVAAAMLLAQANGGLGEIKAAEARAAERDAQRLVSEIERALSEWNTQHALSSALLQFKADDEVALINEQLVEKDQEIAEARSRKADETAILEDLQNDAAEAISRAQAQHEYEGRMRLDAGNGSISETQRARLIEQAAEYSRIANQHDKQASRLLAEAMMQAPIVQETESEIMRLTTQWELLNQAAEQLRELERVNQSEAQRARQEADVSRLRLEAALDQLRQQRDTTGTLLDESIAYFEQSVAAARKATRSNDRSVKSSAKTVQAVHVHDHAEQLWLKARMQEDESRLLARLASVDAPLPKASDYARAAQQAGAAAEEIKNQAKEAFEEAKTQFEGLSGAEAQEKAARINAKITAMVEQNFSALPAATATMPVSTSSGGSVADDIKSTFRNMASHIEAKDFRAVRQYFVADEPTWSAILDEVAEIADSASRFDAMCETQFGDAWAQFKLQQADEAAGMTGNMNLDMDFDELASQMNQAIDMIQVQEIDSTHAMLILPEDAGAPMPVPMELRNGQWTIVVPVDEIPIDPAMLTGPVQTVKVILAETMRDLKDGAYQTPDQMMQALQVRAMSLVAQVMPLMMELQGQGMDGMEDMEDMEMDFDSENGFEFEMDEDNGN